MILDCKYLDPPPKPEFRCVVCATKRPTNPNRLITAPTASKARRIASRRRLDQDATPGTSQPLGQRSAWSYRLSSNFAPHVSQNTYNILLHSFTAVATQLYGILYVRQSLKAKATTSCICAWNCSISKRGLSKDQT